MDLEQFGGRTDDDLFADDIEPVAYEETTIVPSAAEAEIQLTPEPTAVAAPAPVAPQQPAAAVPSPTAAPSRPPPPKSLAQSRHNQRPDKPQRASTHHKAPENPATPASNQDAITTSASASSGPPPTAPKGPAAGIKNTNRASAVSEARLGSGANPRQKLTEAELADRMEKMRLVNAEKTRQFEQAQRDESEHAVAYAKGMEDARKKRAEEAARRKVAEEERKRLEDERAKNRDRKLKAMGLKEGGWDAGKEERLREEEPRGFKGAHGGIRGAKGQGLSGSRFASSSGDGFEGDGFGDTVTRRGGRGGRRGGRGGSRQLFNTGDDGDDHSGGYRNRGRNQNLPPHQPQQQPAAPPPPAKKLQDESEFPALPGAKTPQVSATWTAAKASGPLPDFSVISPVGQWADDVDDNTGGSKSP